MPTRLLAKNSHGIFRFLHYIRLLKLVPFYVELNRAKEQKKIKNNTHKIFKNEEKLKWMKREKEQQEKKTHTHYTWENSKWSTLRAHTDWIRLVPKNKNKTKILLKNKKNKIVALFFIYLFVGHWDLFQWIHHVHTHKNWLQF